MVASGRDSKNHHFCNVFLLFFLNLCSRRHCFLLYQEKKKVLKTRLDYFFALIGGQAIAHCPYHLRYFSISRENRVQIDQTLRDNFVCKKPVKDHFLLHPGQIERAIL